jgi:hypothetical protein
MQEMWIEDQWFGKQCSREGKDQITKDRRFIKDIDELVQINVKRRLDPFTHWASSFG